ncbi:MAG TPA: hypothetical protein PKK10_12095 [Woeseiaceae bacterium]|nr:hypothetical protein [Woeseiaceae bacterium]
MSDVSKAAVDWRQLREFHDVDIGHSYILSWKMQADTLVIDVDLVLTEQHPFYVPLRPAQKACICAATLEFPACSLIVLDHEQRPATPAEVADTLRGGMIESLCRIDDGPYVISGKFGTVSVTAERPILRLQRT